MKISQKNRKIGYSYSSISGFYAFRGEKSIEFESTLERDLLTSLEFNPTVLDVIEQPITIEYVNNNGRLVTYTPDFLVHYYLPNSKVMSKTPPLSRLIEVKPNRILHQKWRELKPRFKVAIGYAQSQGWIFNIFDESRIHTTYFKNINFVNRYKPHCFDPSERERIISHIGNIGHTTIDHIIESLYVSKYEKGIAIAHLWHLIANQLICCDMTQPLNMASTVWLNDNIIGDFV